MHNYPGENMIYYKAFREVYLLWRDQIFGLFVDPRLTDWKAIDKAIDRNVEIVGEHYSKSIKNPVVKISYQGCEIVVRYNFYDYEIAVISPYDLEIPKSLFISEGNFYYQGFPDEYKLNKYYSDTNKRVFMANVRDNYRFFTFMYIISEQLNNEMWKKARASINDE